MMVTQGIKQLYRTLSYPVLHPINESYEKALQSRLKAHEFSIICSNCMGGGNLFKAG